MDGLIGKTLQGGKYTLDRQLGCLKMVDLS